MSGDELRIANEIGAINAKVDALAPLIQSSHDETRTLSSAQVHARLTRVELSIGELKDLISSTHDRTNAAIEKLGEAAKKQEERMVRKEDDKRALWERALKFLEKPWLWLPLVAGSGYCGGQYSNGLAQDVIEPPFAEETTEIVTQEAEPAPEKRKKALKR
jgi:SpoVK/Ycf46/Vps4 family AAA+-type ATPase